MSETTHPNAEAAEAARIDADASANGPAEDGANSNPAEGAPAPGAADAAAVEAMQSELAREQDRRLRIAAEYQNYRRRTEQEKAGLLEMGKSLVVQQLLDVVDDLQRSLEAAEAREQGENDPAYVALKEGVDLVYRKFMDEMKRLGVEPIEAEGQPFDEHLHDAMLQQPAPEGTAPGTVLQEFQRGYRMGDRVLRHARVIVAS